MDKRPNQQKDKKKVTEEKPKMEEESFEDDVLGEEDYGDDVYQLDGDMDDNEEFRGLELDENNDDADEWKDESGIFNSDPDTFNNSKAIYMKPACVVQSFEGHTQGVLNIGINPKNKLEFISGGLDDRLCVWKTSSQSPLVTHPFSDSVSFVEYGFEGKIFAAACLDNTIKVFDNNPETQFAEKFELKGMTDEITVR